MILRNTNTKNDSSHSANALTNTSVTDNDSRVADSPATSGTNVALDVPFSVPFVHRLRTTRQIAGEDFPILLDLILPDHFGPIRVLLVAERPVAESSNRVSELARQLRACAEIKLVNNVVLVDGGEAVKNDAACVGFVGNII